MRLAESRSGAGRRRIGEEESPAGGAGLRPHAPAGQGDLFTGRRDRGEDGSSGSFARAPKPVRLRTLSHFSKTLACL